MKIDSYQANLSASYYSLEFSSTTAKVQSDSSLFDELSGAKVNSSGEKRANTSSRELEARLAKEILYNLSSANSGESRLALETTYMEARSLNFEANAIIKSGNKELSISLSVSLSQSFVAQNITVLGANFYDPLVISLDGGIPQLSQKRFSFDIDADGKKDQISLLQNGNAFLAYDRNSNGRIDDGSELFGLSGDGFRELRAFDDDNNGWIDENDAIFDKLRVWIKTENEDRLVALGEVGIGAIFLGSVNTPFDLKSDINTTLGTLQKSGFFLFENGKAGVMSQLDLVASMSEETKELLGEFNSLVRGSFKDRNALAYTKEDEQSEKSAVQKLQEQVRKLEGELKTAPKDRQKILQSEIAVINAQILQLLAEEAKRATPK